MTNAILTRRAALQLAGIMALGLPKGRSQPANQYGTAAGPNEAAFDEVWQTVRDRFYDPHLHGLDWPAIRAEYRPQAAAAASKPALAGVINAMLARLGASHTEYYTPDEPAYYQLAGIFAGALRRHGLQRVFPAGEVTYPGIGIFTRAGQGGRVFVTGVIDGAPASQAGLLLGDEILSADGTPFQPVNSFRGKVGTPVSIAIRRRANEAPMLVEVTAAQLDPNAMFLKGLQASTRIIPGPGGARVGYVHVWCYAGYAYQRALEQLIVEGPLGDADALIWDLRDGWGGAQPDYLDLFNPRAPTMRIMNRSGEITYEGVHWRKPASMLVNHGTRSGKEVLAYGFKRYRIGEVIGSQTAGALLAASAFLMSNGDLLLLAVADVRVDGQRLEGVGVAPTIEVPFDPAFAAGSDPQLERALHVLSQTAGAGTHQGVN